jgi:class 3 adenylate cyclase
VLDVPALDKGYALLRSTPYPYFREVALGHECRFLHGVVEAVLAMHTFRKWQVSELLCSARIRNIVRGAYGVLGWTYDEDDHHVYVDGKRIGAKVSLARKGLDGETVLWPELAEEPGESNAVLITEDFTHDGLIIFRRDEIYDAPYCLFEASWEVYSLIGRLQSYFELRGSKPPLSVDELEQQIEFTNRKLFEVQEALTESERRLKITEIYTRKSLVEMIRSGDDPTTSPAREEEMTVMFSDIRDFASLSESMSAQDIVGFLNGYFNRMNGCILRNGGEIDKLMGDCIMAGFTRCPDAVGAGNDMKLELAEYNRQRVSHSHVPVRTGIGMTYGNVIVGNIGSSSKLDHTLIGDTVNASARVESLTKQYRLGLLVSEWVKTRLPEGVTTRFIDFTTVKGLKVPMRIYEIYEYEPDRIKEKKLDIQRDLEAAFGLYQDGKFEEAGRLYDEMKERVGPHTYFENVCADPVLDFFSDRCRSIVKRMDTGMFSLKDWDGIHRPQQG